LSNLVRLQGSMGKVANRIIMLAEGNIIEEGHPSEIFDNPKHERTKRFLNQIL
jgi:polar amino acid transport system ATP-binding protein